MFEKYDDELLNFANFYFKNWFKGNVIVERLYEPRALSSKIIVKIKYNEVYIADTSQPIEDYTNTLDVLDILDELVCKLKLQYDSKLSESQTILK